MGDRASADSLRGNLDLVLDQRVADMADLPDGAIGFPPKTSRARIVTLWVKGLRKVARLQADASTCRVSLPTSVLRPDLTNTRPAAPQVNAGRPRITDPSDA